jgi:hypothetical protein
MQLSEGRLNMGENQMPEKSILIDFNYYECQLNVGYLIDVSHGRVGSKLQL